MVEFHNRAIGQANTAADHTVRDIEQLFNFEHIAC